MIGDFDNNARPLTFVEQDDSVGFRNVSDSHLRTFGKVPDERAYHVEGSPSAQEIIGIEVRVD